MNGNTLKRILALILFIGFVQLYGQSFSIDTIQWNGDINKRINIVVLGDGYTQNQLGKFRTDAQKISQDLFAEVPFANYEAFFNVVSISVASNVSGAANDPSMLIDNYFGSSFNVSGIQRLLVPMRSWRVSELLAIAFPSFDQVIMLVNDNRYGGSGGWLATSSTHPSAGEIAIHEIGHSFSRLSDEYYAGDQFARETPNMTRETDPQRVKWRNWMGVQGIGIFQHCCGGNSAQWYRPHQNCKMNALGVPFCAVCRETTVARTYQLVSFLDHFTPSEKIFTLEEDSVVLKTHLIHPSPSTLQIQWFLNGEPLENNFTDSVSLHLADLSLGNNEVICSITDTTALVRINGHSNQIIKEVTWTIERLNTSVQIVQASDHEWKVQVFPNPANDWLQLRWNKNLSGRLDLDLFNSNGIQVYKNSQIVEGSKEILLNIPKLQEGMYWIQVRHEGRVIGTKTVMLYSE